MCVSVCESVSVYWSANHNLYSPSLMTWVDHDLAVHTGAHFTQSLRVGCGLYRSQQSRVMRKTENVNL